MPIKDFTPNSVTSKCHRPGTNHRLILMGEDTAMTLIAILNLDQRDLISNSRDPQAKEVSGPKKGLIFGDEEKAVKVLGHNP